MELLPSYRTEFYISDCGYLVIKQEHIECGYEAQFLISPDQTKVLFNLLPDLMQEQTGKWNGLYMPAEE